MRQPGPARRLDHARLRRAYGRLHRLGWAHSVEAWRDGRLAGGLYGVGIGGLFAGESMFHRERDASKVALLGLVDLIRDEYADQRVLDVQWQTPHLASLGVVDVRAGSTSRRSSTPCAPAAGPAPRGRLRGRRRVGPTDHDAASRRDP